MSKRLIHIAAFLVLVQAGSASAEAPPGDVLPQVQAALRTHCGECHGATQPKAKLRLDKLTAEQWGDYKLLDGLAAAVAERRMPPKKARTALADARRAQLIDGLAQRLATLEEQSGTATLARLTRREWCDTVKDLAGVEVPKQYRLPVDSTQRMKRIDADQVLTPLALKQYHEVADDYVDRIILPTLPGEKTYSFTFKDEKQFFVGKPGQKLTQFGILSHNDHTVVSVKSPVTDYALEGVYELKYDYIRFHSDEWSEKDKNNTRGPRPAALSVDGHFAKLRGGGEILTEGCTKDSQGKKLHPSGKVVKYRLDQPIRIRLVKLRGNVISIDLQNGGLGAARPGEKKGKLRWLMKGVTIRGPIDKGYPTAHARIFGDARPDGSFDDCKRVLDDLARKLFRRPVDEAIMRNYYALARAEYDRAPNLYAAVKPSLKAMLCSPYFLFKYTGGRDELDGPTIASRLSYFLSNSMPDERLRKLAAEGKLADPEVRKAEALRLLADKDRANRFFELFVSQWLGMERFGAFSPNAAYIEPDRYAPYLSSLRREPAEFFKALCYENLSGRHLIESDLVVWDRLLAEYYSKQDGSLAKHARARMKNDTDFVLVRMAEVNRNRDTNEPHPERLGGLISMAAIMSMTTDGETSLPILRGAWVAEHMLGLKMEPPDTVPSIEVNLANVSKPKDILRLHKQDPSCASCHVKMDYLGLALENYDVLGMWNESYVFPVLGGKKGNTPELAKRGAIDSKAEGPDGKIIDGVAGLKRHLREREAEVMRNLVENLFMYASCRNLRYKDRAEIDRILQAARAKDYRLRDLILEIVTSESFVRR